MITVYRFDNIHEFFTLSTDGVLSHYRRDARTPTGQLIEYHGPGSLTIYEGGAILEMYESVNPQASV